MRPQSRLWFALILFLIIGAMCFSGHAEASCRNPNLVQENEPFAVPVVASGFLEIKWFGHSFFQITSSGGTKIITDPFGAMGFPMPEVRPNVVTIGRDHGNHNNAGLAKGSPIVLRGIKEGSSEWNDINLTFRDVLIYNVPVHQRGYPGYQGSMKGSAFVFEVDGLCILHSGDISEPFNEDQLQLIGHVDVLLVVIGGTFTAGPDEAKQIIQQLKPKVVVPMHFWYRMNIVERFTEGPYPARFIEGNAFSVSKDTLPNTTEIFVLKVAREGEQ
jgi:L-ascorbate metabolism protein UlaG (beta-lactamase superfamily)